MMTVNLIEVALTPSLIGLAEGGCFSWSGRFLDGAGLRRDIDVVLGRRVVVGRQGRLATQPDDTLDEPVVVVNCLVGQAEVRQVIDSRPVVVRLASAIRVEAAVERIVGY